jgi:hypothetical protein
VVILPNPYGEELLLEHYREELEQNYLVVIFGEGQGRVLQLLC